MSVCVDWRCGETWDPHTIKFVVLKVGVFPLWTWNKMASCQTPKLFPSSKVDKTATKPRATNSDSNTNAFYATWREVILHIYSSRRCFGLHVSELAMVLFFALHVYSEIRMSWYNLDIHRVQCKVKAYSPRWESLASCRTVKAGRLAVRYVTLYFPLPCCEQLWTLPRSQPQLRLQKRPIWSTNLCAPPLHSAPAQSPLLPINLCALCSQCAAGDDCNHFALIKFALITKR